MPNLLRRKLQIFISSTYLDLEKDRQAAVTAILSAEHIPAGMELFAAGDKSQWETIKRWIDDSDMFMLILGGRYGSIDPSTDLSYTEMEYDYALSKGKPFFALVIDPDELDRRSKELGPKVVLELDHRDKYEKFRQKVESKIRKHFSDLKDIKIETLNSIVALDHEHSLVGWVRGERVTDTKVLIDEIARLKLENDKLQHEVKKAHESVSALDNQASLDAEFRALAFNLVSQEANITSALPTTILDKTPFNKLTELIKTKLDLDTEPPVLNQLAAFMHYSRFLVLGLRTTKGIFTSSPRKVEGSIRIWLLEDLIEMSTRSSQTVAIYQTSSKGKKFYRWMDTILRAPILPELSDS